MVLIAACVNDKTGVNGKVSGGHVPEADRSRCGQTEWSWASVRYSHTWVSVVLSPWQGAAWETKDEDRSALGSLEDKIPQEI